MNGLPSRFLSLMLAQKSKDKEFHELSLLSNKSICKKSICKIRLPQIYDKVFMTSCGWLIIVGEDFSSQLINPLSCETINHLKVNTFDPEYFLREDSEWYGGIRKLILLTNNNQSTLVLPLVVVSWGWARQLGFCQPGDSKKDQTVVKISVVPKDFYEGMIAPVAYLIECNYDHPGMVLTLTPFNGSNFLGWIRTMKMALGAKLKLGFINGTCIKPAMDGENLQRWIRCDYMKGMDRVMALLSTNSRENYPMKMQECSCNLVDKFLEIEGRSKLIQFLMKLNDEYESVRNQILAMDPLPTVNKAYYIVQQIEKQKQVTNHVAEPMAFYANMNQNKAGRKDVKGGRNDVRGYKHCTNCDQDGHTAEQCFEKIGYPDWYKGKKNKKNGKFVANVMDFGQETPFDMKFENELQRDQSFPGVDQKLVAAVCQEVMKMFQGKHGGQDLNGASTSMHHAGMSLHVRTFALSSQSNGIRINQWIIDTCASDDMCPHITLFSITFILTQPITVHLPDGTSKLVTTAGHIQLTTFVMLFNVIYVPEFKFNLLSVGKLLNTQKYFAQLFPSYCVFQDLLTKEVIAVGKGSRCLYTCTSLDPTSIPTEQQVVNSINVFYFQNSSVFSKVAKIARRKLGGRVPPND
ncbi:pyridoxal 5'-phosphate synthase-like subunit PDX1.2 [Tanacetum coccineum]